MDLILNSQQKPLFLDAFYIGTQITKRRKKNQTGHLKWINLKKKWINLMPLETNTSQLKYWLTQWSLPSAFAKDACV